MAKEKKKKNLGGEVEKSLKENKIIYTMLHDL